MRLQIKAIANTQWAEDEGYEMGNHEYTCFPDTMEEAIAEIDKYLRTFTKFKGCQIELMAPMGG